MPNPVSGLGFVATDEEAAHRHERFENVDPFPDIPPALLNATDIYDYARVTGMIWPFEVGDRDAGKKLKSASYEVDFLGEVYSYADTQGKHCTQKIERNVPFVLPKNSITFVSLATTFRLPYYIALRFNLRIIHVQRGLLLGTGPLVDPGFAGRLLIPLHNLTSEDYTLIGGEGLIWVEFTKLSPSPRWDDRARKSDKDFVRFPPEKRYLTAQQYFNMASHGIPARSSIPEEVRSIQKVANETRRLVRLLIRGGIAGIVLAVLGLLIPTWSLIQDANKNVSESSKSIADYRKSEEELEKKVRTLEADLGDLRKTVTAWKDKATVVRPSSPSGQKRGTQPVSN